MAMKYLCIIQARRGSTRLPSKILLKAGGETLLEHQIRRLKLSKKINKIVVATTTHREDDTIEKLCRKVGAVVYRGSEEDVLDRFYQCARAYPNYSAIVRSTGDCPLIDPQVVDEVIAFFEKGQYDYASNVEKETFPDGMDIEVFKRAVLERSWRAAKMTSEREHVTLHMRRKGKIKKGNLAAPYDFSHFRLTVDERADFEVVKFLIENTKLTDGYLEYISVLTKNPRVMLKNLHIIRNEGLLKSLRHDRRIK